MGVAHWANRKRRRSKLESKKERFLERELRPKHPRDIFVKKFRVPNSVIILAPGFGADVAFSHITPDDYVIAVNRGVRAPVDHVNAWILADKNAPNAFWFLDPTPEGCVNLFDDGFLRKYIDRTPSCPHRYHYVFRTGWRLEQKDSTLRYGVLRGGCTASIQALQLAFFCGAKDIRLCGVRFEGSKYWDGRESGAFGTRKGVWPIVPRVNNLIKWMKRQHVYVSTMSDTALGVPVWRGMTAPREPQGRTTKNRGDSNGEGKKQGRCEEDITSQVTL